MSLADLIAKLESAEGPSRALDAEIALALDPVLIRPTVITRDGAPPSNFEIRLTSTQVLALVETLREWLGDDAA